jgi:hypothetical protein
MGGYVILTIGLQQAKVTIGLMYVAYYMKLLLQLLERDANVAKGDLMNHDRKGVSVSA